MYKNFFNISDFNKQELLSILNDNNNDKVLENKSIGLIFEKYSTRTRLSFAVGISNLGGNSVDIRFEELNISREESFEDTFRAMNCYLDGLIYRTDDHKKLLLASSYFDKPIINALSDISHPCQVLSDLFTLKEYFNSYNCHILWMGDMNNVCFSLVEAVNIFKEIKLTICTPSSVSEDKNWLFGPNISILNNIKDVELETVNCVMTDVFVSMNDEDDKDKVKSLSSYIVNEAIMKNTLKNSIFMHCLPAKVGMEVTEEVLRGNHSIVWKQAYNRMVAQKKLLKFLY